MAEDRCPRCGMTAIVADRDTSLGICDPADIATVQPPRVPDTHRTTGESLSESWEQRGEEDDFQISAIPPYRAPVAAARQSELTSHATSTDSTSTFGATRVEGYQLFEELGRGGMGVVYRALQVTLNRFVALKMLHDGSEFKTEQVDRMRIEAQAIARLADPHVVQVFDVGETRGRPYMALELVQGKSLDLKTQSMPQPSQQSAQTVLILAQTMERVHREGIIHRDLKPSNILVEDDGTPKITDFGLAKFAGSQADATRTGAILGTPNFMSPEQAAGLKHQVDHSSDIYALGGILYYLLTGRPPFQADSLIETLRQVVDEEPAQPRALNSKIDRDLETICLKCLDKRKDKRYSTAGELAEDLSRYLANRPILARPVGTSERMTRWCRRNPMIATLTAAMLMVGMVGFAGVFWQWRDAEYHRQAAEREARLKDEQYRYAEEARTATRASLEVADRRFELARSFVQDLHRVTIDGPTAKTPGASRFRQDLMQLMLGYYRQLLDEQPQDESLPLEQAQAQFKIGTILTELGEFPKAKESLEKAITAQRELCAESPNDRSLAMRLADSLTALGTVEQKTGSLDRAEACLRESIKLLQQQRDASLLAPEEKVELAITLRMLGGLLQDREAYEDALSVLLQARELFDQVSDEWLPADIAWLEWVAVNNQIATVSVTAGDVANAASTYQESIDVCNRYLAVEEDEQVLLLLAISQQNLAHLYTVVGRPRDAIAMGRASVSGYERLEKANPNVPDYRNYKAGSQLVVASALVEVKQIPDAIELLKESLADQQWLIENYPDSAEYLQRMCRIKWQLGGAFLEAGNLDQAIDWYRHVRDDRLAILADHPDSTLDKSGLSDVEVLLGTLVFSQGDQPAGLELIEQSISRQEALLAENRGYAERQLMLMRSFYTHSVALLEQNEMTRAIASLQRAFELGVELDGEQRLAVSTTEMWIICANQLAYLLRQSDQDGASQTVNRQAWQLGSRHLPARLSPDESMQEAREAWLRITSNASLDLYHGQEFELANQAWKSGIDRLPSTEARVIELHRALTKARSQGFPMLETQANSFDASRFSLTGVWVGELSAERSDGYAILFERDEQFIGALTDDEGRLTGWDVGTYHESDGELELRGAFSLSTIAIDPYAADAMDYEVIESTIPEAAGLRFPLFRQ